MYARPHILTPVASPMDNNAKLVSLTVLTGHNSLPARTAAFPGSLAVGVAEVNLVVLEQRHAHWGCEVFIVDTVT